MTSKLPLALIILALFACGLWLILTAEPRRGNVIRWQWLKDCAQHRPLAECEADYDKLHD